MMVDWDTKVVQVDQVGYRYSFGNGICFEIFAYFKSFVQGESRFVEVFKKNWDDFFNLGYMYLKMGCYQVWSNLGQLELVLG